MCKISIQQSQTSMLFLKSLRNKSSNSFQFFLIYVALPNQFWVHQFFFNINFEGSRVSNFWLHRVLERTQLAQLRNKTVRLGFVASSDSVYYVNQYHAFTRANKVFFRSFQNVYEHVVSVRTSGSATCVHLFFRSWRRRRRKKVEERRQQQQHTIVKQKKEK